MNKKLKTGLLIMAVLALSISMMAFRPFNGDGDDDGIPDQTTTLAEVLGIDVETLQAAYETAQEKALEQALANEKITQEQINVMGEKEGAGMRGGPRGMNNGEFLADALGITVEVLQAAQQEVHQTMLDQALADGDITQEQYDNILERSVNKPDFEDGEFPTRPEKDGKLDRPFGNGDSDLTVEERVAQALEDGKITEEQAESILNGEMPFGPGRRGPGGHGGGMKPGGGRPPKPESSEGE